MYPAKVSSFFERDIRAMIEAGVEIDVFSVAPLDQQMWQHSIGLLGPTQLPPSRVHHLGLAEAMRGARRVRRSRVLQGWSDVTRILPAAARFGAVPFAKTVYVLPKAWAWAAAYGDRYDHILAYWGNYAGTCAYVFHRLAGRPIPFSIWLHAGADLYKRPVFMREKLLYADNIITCCEFNEGYITGAFADIAAQTAPKIRVCHHGLDLARFPYQPEARPANRILAVGRLARHKGFDYLVRAVAALRQRGVDVTLAFGGEGKERGPLEALATELGIGGAVRFLGWLKFDDVRRAMSEATVLVHPSDGLGDGLPNVVREAMALGTPVVASDVAGIPDALSGGCGVLVPPRDVDALANALEQVLADPAGRQRIAAKARQRAQDQYDMWQNGARLARLLAATRRGQPPAVPTAPPPSAAMTAC
jgi:glycosyltransferase involved in cell wall biosynthesis